jgi:NADPH2:quinone reductase
MKAAVSTPNGLELRDIPQPVPKPNEVLVRVKACGLKSRGSFRGARDVRSRRVGAALGLEHAGEVVDVGGRGERLQAGDSVVCAAGGGYAEYAVADSPAASLRSQGPSASKQAAVLPVALNTLHNALITRGRLKAGESVLIQGASSGVGLMGLQIAKMKGAKPVMGSATNDARRARLKDFGADLAVDTRDEKWPDQVLEATGGKGVNLSVDMVSGPLVNPLMKATAVLGRIINVGRLGGVTAEFNFDLHAMKRIDYIGVTNRNRTLDELREVMRLMHEDLWDAVTAGKLTLPVDRTFPLEQAIEAQAYMKANQHFGKIALVM